MKTYDVIIKPAITEKATRLGEKMIYTFYVDKRATKVDVKMAVKELYGQAVDTVKMAIIPAKKKAVRRMTIDKRPEMKKAFVTLKGKKKMDISKISKDSPKKS